ncbi:MAG: hypothetical protein Q4D82_01420 [Neisseria sp.]|nr:hypothetical protein [Neisseria sp.]
MADLVKFKGVKVELGGEIYVVPPLTLGALEQLQDDIAKMNGNTAFNEQVNVISKVGLAALQRNYPEMTREKLLEIVDVSNMNELFEAVMDVSGLKRKAQEEAGN